MKKRTRPEKERVSLLEKGCIRIVQLLLCGILLFLTVLSACVTCTVYGGAEIVEYGRDRLLLHAALFAALALLLKQAAGYRTGLRRLLYENEEYGADRSCVRYIMAAAGALTVWVLFLLSWAGSDSRLCMESARRLLAGDMSPWMPYRFMYSSLTGAEGYAYTYPVQNGLILYMSLVYFFFREAAPYVMQILNIGFLILGMISLSRFVMLSGGFKRPERLALLLILYLPFSFYILFVYGTMPGFGLSCLALYLIGRYVREEKSFELWGGAAAITAAVLLKSNYLIVCVALILYLASEGVFRQRPRFAGAALLVAAVYLLGSRGMGFCMERITGSPASDGIPMTAWAEMGLQEGERGPGWYNGYNVWVFWENGGDKELAKEAVWEDFHQTLEDMAANPKEAASFFVRKVASIWAEPTFQSLWIQEIGKGSWLLPRITDSFLRKGGILNAVYLVLANWAQTFIYAGALLWLILEWRKMEWEALIPGIIFIGGFLFHLVWEAKGQYTVCYFVLLIPYAWMGIRRAAGCHFRFRRIITSIWH